MKKLFTILAIIASFFAILFSVLPISNLAIIPGIIALVLALIAFYISKRNGQVKKIIPFTLLLTVMALAISSYKAFFTKTEVASTKVLDAKEVKLEEEAIEELEGLEIEDLEINDFEIEDIPNE